MNQIKVVGAGPAGLATALSLDAMGMTCSIIEQSVQLPTLFGGLQITPNGHNVLSALGLGPDLERIAVPIADISVSDLDTGREIMKLDTRVLTGKSQARYLAVRRSDLVGLLLQHAENRGIRIDQDSRVEAFTPSGTGMSWRCTSGRQGSAGIVIGADGINSVARKHLDWTVHQPDPFYRIWRTTVDGDNAGIKVTKGTVFLHVGQNRHLVRYRPGPGSEVNVVGVELWPAIPDRDYQAPGWLACQLVLETDSFRPPRGMVHSLAKSSISRVWNCDRMVLVGDALHPMLPFLAQGANMALEDAYVLARCMQRSGTAREGFMQYRHLRSKRLERVLRMANHQSFINHTILPGLGIMARSLLGPVNRIRPQLLAGRYRWIFEEDVTSSVE